MFLKCNKTAVLLPNFGAPAIKKERILSKETESLRVCVKLQLLLKVPKKVAH
jgi:hypothetical protein